MQTFLVKKGRRPFINDFHVSIKDKTIAIPALPIRRFVLSCSVLNGFLCM